MATEAPFVYGDVMALHAALRQDSILSAGRTGAIVLSESHTRSAGEACRRRSSTLVVSRGYIARVRCVFVTALSELIADPTLYWNSGRAASRVSEAAYCFRSGPSPWSRHRMQSDCVYSSSSAISQPIWRHLFHGCPVDGRGPSQRRPPPFHKPSGDAVGCIQQ